MKLRNKKTGEIYDSSRGAISEISVDNGDNTFTWYIKLKLDASLLDKETTIWKYPTLASFAKDWEDVKEPLIKDEKVRKAVKAWAEANGDDCYYIVSDYRIDDGSSYSIEFCNSPFEDLENRHYTIRELCGDD